MFELPWLKAAAFDQTVHQGLNETEVDLNPGRALNQVIALAQPLEGLRKSGEIVVYLPDLKAPFELPEH
jgi:hypothetical protein